jgi:predicted ATP-grasp superfamily ATP-dependent carboligase
MIPASVKFPEDERLNIVVPGFYHTALSTLRCLRGLESARVRLISCGEDSPDLGILPAKYSNIPHITLTYPKDSLVPFLLELHGRFIGRSKPLLLLTADRQVIDVIQHRQLLESKYEFLLPENSIVELLMEKTKFQTWALAHDWPVARTEIITDLTALRRVSERVPFPFAVKPYLLHAMRVNNTEELEEYASNFTPLNYQAMVVQDWIPGEDDQIYFCFLLFDRAGEVASSFVGRKLRQFPRYSGHTSLAISAEDPGNLIEMTAAFFKSLAYRGYGAMEYKFDARTKRWVIMEPTVGRFDLQIALTAAAGVNFPANMARLLAGQEVRPTPWKSGTYWIFEYDDLNSFLRGHRGYGLIRNFLGRHTTVLFSWTDPLPMLRLSWHLLGRLMRRLLNRARPPGRPPG